MATHRRDEGSGRSREGVPRGAWYADPYGKAQERWWDGGKWTAEVRGSAASGGSSLEAREARTAGHGQTSARERGEEIDALRDSFAMGIEAAGGKKLRLAPRDPRPYGHFDLHADGERVGTLIIGGAPEIASMACAEGTWVLRKRLRRGWELVIESADGRHCGWYSGRRWLPGGTISLTDGTQAELRRSLLGRWSLALVDAHEPLIVLRRSGTPASLSMVGRVRAFPAEANAAPILIPTACAVLMLQRTLPPLINPAPS